MHGLKQKTYWYLHNYSHLLSRSIAFQLLNSSVNHSPKSLLIPLQVTIIMSTIPFSPLLSAKRGRIPLQDISNLRQSSSSQIPLSSTEGIPLNSAKRLRLSSSYLSSSIAFNNNESLAPKRCTKGLLNPGTCVPNEQSYFYIVSSIIQFVPYYLFHYACCH